MYWLAFAVSQACGARICTCKVLGRPTCTYMESSSLVSVGPSVLKIMTTFTFLSSLISSCTDFVCGMLRKLNCHYVLRCSTTPPVVQMPTHMPTHACCAGISLYCWQVYTCVSEGNHQYSTVFHLLQHASCKLEVHYYQVSTSNSSRLWIGTSVLTWWGLLTACLQPSSIQI